MCETAATAGGGRNNFSNEELSFVDDLDGLTDPFDVAMATGALQYTDAPVLQQGNGGFYQASLPAWFFSEAGWLVSLDDRAVVYQGFALRRRR